MSEKCCGNCKRFSCEDVDGFGWCIVFDMEYKCDHYCTDHEPEVDDDPLVLGA